MPTVTRHATADATLVARLDDLLARPRPAAAPPRPSGRRGSDARLYAEISSMCRPSTGREGQRAADAALHAELTRMCATAHRPGADAALYAELTRFCQTGRNKGKPGVCPEDLPVGAGRAASTGAQARKKALRSGAPAPAPASEQAEGALRGLLSRAQAAGVTVQKAAAAAKSKVSAATWDKLPHRAQERLAAVGHKALAIYHFVERPMQAGKELALQVARDRGLPDKHVERAGRILAIIDNIGAWGPNAGIVHHAAHALGGPAAFALAKVASVTPVASLAYLGYHLAAETAHGKNPFRLISAARAAVKARPTVSRHAESDWVARLFAGLDGPDADWFEALVAAALDETGDARRAVELATEAAQKQPQPPAGDDSLETFSERAMAPAARSRPRPVTVGSANPGEVLAAFRQRVCPCQKCRRQFDGALAQASRDASW